MPARPGTTILIFVLVLSCTAPASTAVVSDEPDKQTDKLNQAERNQIVFDFGQAIETANDAIAVQDFAEAWCQ